MLAAAIVNYLDDFLGIGDQQEDKAKADFLKVQEVARYCGIPISESKLIGPTTELEFIGFTINTVAMTISMPREKCIRYKNDILNWDGSKGSLESIHGKLLHTTQCLKMARPFLKRIRQKMLKVEAKRDTVVLGSQERKDLHWWIQLMDSWVGTALMTFGKWRCSPDMQLQTDASGRIGYGAVWGAKWFGGLWNWELREETVENIAVLELVPIVLAAKVWGEEWSRMKVRFLTDNEAVASAGTSWSPKHAHLSKLLRVLARLAIEGNFEVSFCHLPGIFNESADAISRNKLAEFRRLNPKAEANPEWIPQEFLDELLHKF